MLCVLLLGIAFAQPDPQQVARVIFEGYTVMPEACPEDLGSEATAYCFTTLPTLGAGGVGEVTLERYGYAGLVPGGPFAGMGWISPRPGYGFAFFTTTDALHLIGVMYLEEQVIVMSGTPRP